MHTAKAESRIVGAWRSLAPLMDWLALDRLTGSPEGEAAPEGTTSTGNALRW